MRGSTGVVYTWSCKFLRSRDDTSCGSEYEWHVMLSVCSNGVSLNPEDNASVKNVVECTAGIVAFQNGARATKRLRSVFGEANAQTID